MTTTFFWMILYYQLSPFILRHLSVISSAGRYKIEAKTIEEPLSGRQKVAVAAL